MAYKRKTWREKMHSPGLPKTEITDKTAMGIPAGATLFIPSPEIVDAYIRNIPFGVRSTLQQMRKDLAAEHHADFCCPLTSGIFLRIVAEAAHEDYAAGKPVTGITPFWRILDKKSPACKKLTFGTGFIKEQCEAEGLKF